MEQPREQFEGSQFLRAVDLPENKTFDMVIEAYTPANTVKDARKKLIDRPSITFTQGSRRVLILNKVNEHILSMKYGQNPEGWIGQECTIARRYGKYFGQENCPCVRIIPRKKWPVQKTFYDLLKAETATPK